MPKSIALLIYSLLILGLLVWDLRRKPKVSWGVWIPLIWVMICGSRAVSIWFDAGLTLYTPDEYIDGSPLDRIIYITLILIGVLQLSRRRIDWRRIQRANPWLFLLVLYGGVSIAWSDFPLVSFKRWVKTIGNIIMVLIVLSDPDPVEAMKALFRRAAYILLPISVLLIKYYPEYGRSYNIWSWLPAYTGVTMNKNSLGFLCLLFGVFFFWRLLVSLDSPMGFVDRKEIMVQVLILLMIVWLFRMAHSMTSILCFMLGIFILLWTKASSKEGTASMFKVFAVIFLFVALIAILAFDPEQILQTSLGRDLTLTGRTDLWKSLIGLKTNPFFGTGFESFWLGERATIMWDKYWWHPNQAHNEYLETYLNLGLIGVFLLVATIVHSFQSIRRSLKFDNECWRFRMAYLIIVVFYNLTEATFKGTSLVWVVFLLIALGPTPISFLIPETPRKDQPIVREYADAFIGKDANHSGIPITDM